MYKLGVIGAGNMAGAIVEGILKKGVIESAQIIISDKQSDKLRYFSQKGCMVSESNIEVVSESDFLLLAVKPQILPSVLDELSPYATGKVFLSIAAGFSRKSISQKLPVAAAVLRAMPNTPLLVGRGATVIAEDLVVPKHIMDFASMLFDGLVVTLPEEKIDAATAVNGSSPAYFFRMAGVMICHAAEQGIDPQIALKLTAKTMEGAAAMLLETGLTPDELVRQVSSPGGSTLAALSAFDELGWDGAIAEAMRRCQMRSAELGT